MGYTTVLARQNFNFFTAKLSGNNEVPPVTTAGSGIATFQLQAVGHQDNNCILKTSVVLLAPISIRKNKAKMDQF